MKINSIAAIKRIPIGTKLIVIHSLLGPCSSGRIVKKIRSKDVVMTINDPGHKNNGQDSYLTLNDVRVENTGRGFRLINKDDGETCVEYMFE